MRSYQPPGLFNKNISLFLVIGILLAGLTATNILLKQENVEPPTLASGTGSCSGDPNSDNNGCINGGNLTNGCNWICQSEIPPGTTLTIPSCCETVAKTGDPHACCFDALRRCTQSTCDAIPEENRKTCGDPPGPCRCGQLWALGYNCSGGSGNPTNTPRPTNPLKPTNTPKPTPKPTRKPRPTKTPKPTKIPPTSTPVYIPVTVTPNPSVTIAPNVPTPTTMIIYITTTPIPITEAPPDFSNNNLVNTPGPSQTSISNPIGGAWDSLVGFISDAKEEGMNIFGNIWKNISEFTQTVAP
ncbi:hypothetical protein HY407_00015 [Candidatus Gottesmanbacteria bacterium]|nr:hypothetical protein [Candidatus Gottesmanbacteria bacterium]